jgi:hypothetical protein
VSEEAPQNAEAEQAPLPRVNFHEGSLHLPTGFEDRTTNLFVPANPQAQPNLSVARDWMKEGETLETYVDRQLSLLKSQLASHRLLVRKEQHLGQGESAPGGQRIDANYKNGKHLIYQRQAAFEVAPQRVLVLTASSPRGFDAAFEELWAHWLASYEPPTPTPTPTPPAAPAGELAEPPSGA